MCSTNPQYLSLEQAAALCNVSVARFRRWIQQGLVPLADGQRPLISSEDLIRHILRYNMPVPERLLNGTLKKILFIFLHALPPRRVIEATIEALYRIRRRVTPVIDFIEHNDQTELKILIFNPDLIILLGKEDSTSAKDLIQQMLTRPIPIHTLATMQDLDPDQLWRRVSP